MSVSQRAFQCPPDLGFQQSPAALGLPPPPPPAPPSRSVPPSHTWLPPPLSPDAKDPAQPSPPFWR
eukprot:CAMPEP_0114146992 /NCGR_PEP_ID=MMETSP0043_2-20121206/20856_1 /TAXON_ID=464988 /ORGANISM="Hemiselmis andersenii, Strain CCMP644" /LENGTH=65 /DNA_ID=CAMNT_0001241475 /DNA_START=1183 /DNA_END=1380 /DNA_ORIENTATION=-